MSSEICMPCDTIYKLIKSLVLFTFKFKFSIMIIMNYYLNLLGILINIFALPIRRYTYCNQVYKSYVEFIQTSLYNLGLK